MMVKGHHHVAIRGIDGLLSSHQHRNLSLHVLHESADQHEPGINSNNQVDAQYEIAYDILHSGVLRVCHPL